jgi:hypothetical protein
MLNIANEDWCGDELKLVFEDDMDNGYIGTLPVKLDERFEHYYIQPCSGNIAPAVRFVQKYANWILSVQIHKVIDIQ